MAKKQKKKTKNQDVDLLYFLKLALYVLVGSQWIWVVDKAGTVRAPIPFGLIFGVVFASHEHFRLDRKVEYAVLLLAALVGFVTQYGIYITA